MALIYFITHPVGIGECRLEAGLRSNLEQKLCGESYHVQSFDVQEETTRVTIIINNDDLFVEDGTFLYREGGDELQTKETK